MLTSYHSIAGVYIYTETSFGRPGTRYILESPLIQSNTSFCLQFWYNRNGDTIGPLYIYDNSTRILTLNDNSHDYWYLDQVNISAGLHKASNLTIVSYILNDYLLIPTQW